MRSTSEKAAAVATVVMLLTMLVDALLAQRTGLLVLKGLLPYTLLAALVSALTWARAHLARRAEEERRDQARARTERAASALFESSNDFEPFSIGRTHAQFERFVVSAVAPLLAVIQGLWAWQLWEQIPRSLAVPSDWLLATAFLSGQAFALFLLSRVLLGIARNPDHRVLRGPGIMTGVAGIASLLAVASSVAGHVGAPAADRYAALALTLGLGLLAVENALSFIVACYSANRARSLGTAYESRLGALLTDPLSWTRSVAQAVDYQFGFNVSESPLYRFVRGALVPLLLAQLLLLYLMSSLVFLGPDEEAIPERLGKPSVAPARWLSGAHLKWPWPFETVRRYPAKRILVTHLGYDPDIAGHRRDVLLWTVPHFRNEDLFLVAGDASGATVPVNLLALNMPIEYRIKDLHDYTYNYAEPESVLRQVAYRALTREAATTHFRHLMGPGRDELTRNLSAQIQQEADRLRLGVEIVFVGLQGIHPPVQVAAAYQSVIGAMEGRETSILLARGYAATTLPIAEADAATFQFEAESYKTRRALLAESEAQQFEKRLATSRKTPSVFRKDLYLGAIERALASSRKYIVDHPAAREVIYFDLQQKGMPDLFELGPFTEEGKH